MWAPFRGAAFIARHGLWRYLAVPVFLNLAIAAGGGFVAVRLARRWVGNLVAVPSAVGSVLFFVTTALLAIALFLIVQPVLSAPFIDVLTERVETLVRGWHPQVGLGASLFWALAHGLLKLVLYASALAAVFVLSVTTGIGGGLGVALYALFLAFDGFDYPLARRGVGFVGKWRYLLLHPGQTLGYCLGAVFLYLVPLAIVVAPAFAAVGATLAYLDLEPAPPGSPHPRATPPRGPTG